MTWPTTFGSLLGGDQPASLFDGMFNQSAAMIQIPCSASGNNAVSLTPLINCPALAAYNELGGYRFRANGNSSGTVTAQFNSLGFLPVYHADGVTQANIGDLANGQEYVLIYSAVLAGGMPGFFLEQPAVTGVAASLGGQPGGRLTLQSATPVSASSVSGGQVIWYAPYVNQFVPIWNGSTLQPYNFCSSLSDQVGLTLPLSASASWPASNAFDIFITLNGGVPVLGTVQWTHPGPSPAPLRATALSIFGGMLTNAAIATMRISTTATISVPANQGTFLGTFYSAIVDGKCDFVFGSAASGGGAASFGICNYYNKVLFSTIVLDNGAPYTYTSATVRQARGSAGNQISYVQSDSERAAQFEYTTQDSFNATPFSLFTTGIGFNSSVAYNNFATAQNQNNNAYNWTNSVYYAASATGLAQVFALEAGDGTHATTFDVSVSNILLGNIWL